jgi:hypothetical protein|tara:strand:+ start:309 stop:848 length:540 start_codon:yes stop_codon:yes gene_type:complete
MIEGSMQIWLGFFLLLLGVSFGRMGPSFQRNRYYLYFLLLGFLSLCVQLYVPNKQELVISNSLENFLPWFSTGFLGYYLVLIGAPTYWKTRYPQLISGWVVILFSFFLYLQYNSDLAIMEVLIASSTLIGILISVLSFALLVRIVENRIPLEEPAPELTDREKEFVRQIISNNIGVDDK